MPLGYPRPDSYGDGMETLYWTQLSLGFENHACLPATRTVLLCLRVFKVSVPPPSFGHLLVKSPGVGLLSSTPIKNLVRSFFFLIFFNVYLFLGQRETEHERGRGRERRRHRIGNRLQALSHQPRARRGARTHGPRNRDLAEVGRLTDCATQAPLNHLFY